MDHSALAIVQIFHFIGCLFLHSSMVFEIELVSMFKYCLLRLVKPQLCSEPPSITSSVSSQGMADEDWLWPASISVSDKDGSTLNR